MSSSQPERQDSLTCRQQVNDLGLTEVQIGPVACTLIGAAFGICWAMVYHQEPLERAHVDLDRSLPLCLAGAVVGFLVGFCVLGLCRRWPRVQPWLTVLIATALGAAIAAPLAWIVGDLSEERTPLSSMVKGAVVGAIAGFVLGMVQWGFDQYRSRAESSNSKNLPRE